MRRNIELEREKEADKEDLTLSQFIRLAWHVLEPATHYEHGWHIDCIAAHLEAVNAGQITRLGMNVPPGTMKSLLTSVFFPAWEWGPKKMPWLRYLTTSHSGDFSKRDARKMRDLVNSDWYQKRWGGHVHLVREAAMSFENDQLGNREVRPYSGLTGGRGDRLIIDDAHNTEEVESEVERETAIRIFRESVPYRINDPRTSAIIIIGQRLHQGDIFGEMDRLGLGYVRVILPRKFEIDRKCVTKWFADPRIEDGETLFPQMMDQKETEKLELQSTAFAWAGQQQQRPSPRSGGMFKREWFKIVDAIPVGTRFCRGWDLAASEATKSRSNPAYTAGVKIGACPGGSYIIANCVRDRVGPAGVDGLIKITADLDGKDVKISIPQDPGQASKSQMLAFAKLLAGFTFVFSPESGDKEMRAGPLASQAEVGNVMMLRGDWNEKFIEEAVVFPGGIFKDQIDASSRAFQELLGTQHIPFLAAPFVASYPRQFPGNTQQERNPALSSNTMTYTSRDYD